MVIKRTTWVSDISDPDQRGVLYINVAFDDNDTAYIGKKDQDKAIEVHGLLTELMEQEVEYQLEGTGRKNKNDGDKWKILGFPGYEAPAPSQGKGVGAGGSASSTSGGGGTAPPIPAHPLPTSYDDREDAIRRAIALKAAVEYTTARGSTDLLSVYLAADAFDKWLQERPGRSHGGDGNGDSLQVPSTVPDVASDSGTTSPESGPGAGEGSSDIRGEADSDCPPHQLDMNSPPKAMGRRPCQKCGAFVRPAA